MSSEQDDKVAAQRRYCKENGLPNFAHSKCVNCGKRWMSYYTLDEAETTHIMACPFCGWSWCA